MEEKERFEEIKERLSALLENQISHFRYTLYVIQVSAFPIMLYPASPPLYTFFVVVVIVKSPCHHSRIASRSQLFAMYDPGFSLWSVSQMVVRFHCFYTWANPAVMSVCSSCISPLHFCLHVCFLSIPALVVFFFLLLPGKEIFTSMMEAFSISLSKNSLKSCNHFCTFHLSLYNMVNKFIAYTINSLYSQHKLEHLVLLVLKD